MLSSFRNGGEMMNCNDNKFYTAKFDCVFKTIFCDEDNPSLLKKLLERIFKKKIDYYRITN